MRAYIRKFRTGIHFDQLGRAPELDEAYVYVAFRTDHKRFQQESRAPYRGVVALFHVLLG